MASSSSSKVVREEFVVRSTDRPGWVAASERAPRAGEIVYCAGGSGVVKAVLGKTGDGSRLLEIHLDNPGTKPFFAAASNVLVAPE
jgi:hypothetical protein